MPGFPLKPFFEPRSVAVVGASASEGKAGYYLLKNVLDGGYEGRVYAVNPSGGRILGCKTYASVRDIPEPVDLAFLVVSNSHVKPVLLDCAQRKTRAVVVVTAGFGEVGEQGAASQRELVEILRTSGIRAVGPNSVGMVSGPNNLMGSFVPFPCWPHGPVAVAAQTGIFTGAYVDEVAAQESQQVGFSRSLCFGNKMDVDEVDFLEYASRDRATSVIALHLESLKRPRDFLSAANRIKKRKPIVLLKTGRSEEGARAAASHSGSLAASDRVLDAALRQYGVIRAATLQEFNGITKALAWQPLPRGNRVGIITFSGALGVMAVDEMQGTGLELARFSPATVRAIAKLMPDWQPVQNPADVWMALGSGPEQAHQQVLEAVLADPRVDMLLAILLPIPNADFTNVRGVFERLRRRHPKKPIFLILMGGTVKRRWLSELDAVQVPDYPDPRLAVRAMESLRFHAERRDRLSPDPLWPEPGRK